MSLWELSAAAAGVARANQPAEPSKPRAPTAEEHFAALERIKEYAED